MRKLPWFYLSVLMGVLLGGLILSQHHLAQLSISENYAHQTQQSPREDTLDYHLLMADMAWQRQMWSEAATHYGVLAQNTQRADFALLATSAALEGQLLPLAQQNAQLWAAIEPLNSKAQALTAALCIASFEEELAFTYLSHLMEYTPDEALPHLMTINQSLYDEQEQQLYFSLLQRLAMMYEHQASVWFALARQAQALHNFALALKATEHTLALQPDWISAIALKVQILYQTGEKLAAKNYLAKVTQILPEEQDLQFIYTQISNELAE
jgi:predicted Zn-dependent protease